ncbi:sodium:solute symporter family transporter [Salinactinospora qingdaonensis]|uniref:Cation acetate symporter n=1 Tax=Salinactinospora qingdaonensis TaxID=702744 RepID=A0ABP7FEI6_9ACTN
MIWLAAVLVLMATVLIAILAVAGGFSGMRRAAGVSTAPRPLSVLSSAAAICGEYVSAAAFLGFASLVFVYGFQAAWLVVAIGVGYLVLLALVVAPLRRSGVYSLSDFAEWRLNAPLLRRVISGCLMLIGWLYLLAQYSAAGRIVEWATEWPPWAGWLTLTVLVLGLVIGRFAAGAGAQALGFCFKITAIAVPAVILAVLWQGAATPVPEATPEALLHEATSVHIRQDQHFRLTQATPVHVQGTIDGTTFSGEGQERCLRPGSHTVLASTHLSFDSGQAAFDAIDTSIPTAIASPGEHESVFGSSVASVYLAVALGIIGLPQLAARFHGIPDPKAARRTVLVAIALIAVFSVFPLIYAGLARFHAGDLLLNGRVDLLLLDLPKRLSDGGLELILTLLLVAGAVTAVITASVSLVRVLAAMISQCMSCEAAHGFRLGALLAVTVPPGVLFLLPDLADVGLMLTVLAAFRLSAVTVAPMVLLGIWWRGLTTAGAVAGIAVGMTGTAASGLLAAQEADWPAGAAVLVTHPTMLLAPLVFATMVTVSLATRRRRPRGVGAKLARMHLPQDLVHG